MSGAEGLSDEILFQKSVLLYICICMYVDVCVGDISLRSFCYHLPWVVGGASFDRKKYLKKARITQTIHSPILIHG